MAGDGAEEKRTGENALARLVAELGRAAQTGWGPTVRWLAFLVVIVAAMVLLAVIGR